MPADGAAHGALRRRVDVGHGGGAGLCGTASVPALMYRLESAGKCLAFTGDTNTTEDLPALAKGADLLLADGLFPEAAWGAQKPHLSAKLCAELAPGCGGKAAGAYASESGV